jgi:hypothetical protein
MTSDGQRFDRRLGRLALAAILLAVGACASRPADGPREYQDEKSAATVTVAPGKLVFARARSELAVHARDYLTLVPIDVNRAGSHAQYFYAYVWSTIDKRGLPAPDAETGQFELVADGRRIPLTPLDATPRELGLAEPPVRAPSSQARLIISLTNRETLEFLARSSDIRAVALHDGLSAAYELWSGDPSSLLALR